jgi:hypothetical protein
VNRKLKKYNLKYEYLKLEEEDIRDDLSKYIKDFDTTFNKYYQTPPPGRPPVREVWVNEETGEVRDTPPDPNEKAKKLHEEAEAKKLKRIEELKSRPDKVKKLYKKLAIYAHPDKGGSDELFQEVNDAYTNNNLMWLLIKSIEYNIDYELDDSDEMVLDKNLQELTNEIIRMKGTSAWIWGTGGKKDRERVVNRVQRETGWEIPQEELPIDLRVKNDEQILLEEKKSLDNKK